MHIPTEDQEGASLAIWLKSQGYKFTHIANEIGISGRVGMLVNNRKKKQGLSKGFPDYCIILKCGGLLFIELKRQKKILKNGKEGSSPSRVSDEQKEWVSALHRVDNVEAHICYGAKQAQELIQSMDSIS